MKLPISLALLLCFSTSFSQWTRIQQLPSSDIFTVYHKDNILYAGGKSIIYISRNNGQTWDSTSIPGLSLVNNIIVYKNELYAAAPSSGVFKSLDAGATWQDASAGIFPEVADFCEFRGDLYAATLGNSVYKLNPVDKNNWLFFSNGLSSLSANINSITGNSNALIGGTISNGLYDYLPANSITWEERFLLGQISPNEGAYDIITAQDTLFFAGQTGRFYMSTDNGLNWSLFGNRLASLYSPLVNARQAVLTSAYFFDGANFNTVFLYIKKDSIQNPFHNFSVVTNHFTYRIDILGDKLWDASDRGLFYMSLSDLPGISAADAPEPVLLPVRFISFTANCDNNKVLLTWKTGQEQNSNHFDIQRSPDGIQWTVIDNQPAARNSSTERSYSFMYNEPLQKGYYRIAEYDLDGRVQYSGILRSACAVTDEFRLWPNPVHDRVFINIATRNASQVMIKVFDSKGALVKMQTATVLQGSNQLNVDMKSLANGFYSISLDWNNGHMRKIVQLLKQ